MSDPRAKTLHTWLTQHFQSSEFTLQALAGDASFRRYFRLQYQNQCYVVMDAPPIYENSERFIAIARIFAKLGVHVPTVFAFDLAQGFLLLSDLGDDLYFNQLNSDNVTLLYTTALHALLKIQSHEKTHEYSLPHFDDHFIHGELHLFHEWFLQKQLGLSLSSATNTLLKEAYHSLITSASQQPHACTHRDYHSRNLLQLTDGNVGVLDFQDAMWGPITYDAVSLLKDCYISWPASYVDQWALEFYAQLKPTVGLHCSAEQFLHWFDWMGLQRHLKVLGIFSRLNLRDNKPSYLQEIPRILMYIFSVCNRYPKLTSLKNFLQDVLADKMPQALEGIC